MVWDRPAVTKGVIYSCGKCGGSDYYIAAQVMSLGRNNIHTKQVEVVTCKTCDIPMLRKFTKSRLVWIIVASVGIGIPLAALLGLFMANIFAYYF